MGKVNLIHEDLSYKVRGILYQVHNELGQYRNEKQYCDAIEYSLKNGNISYKREFILPPSFAGERQGRNRIDFVIENQIVLEVKAVPTFSKEDYRQCLRYLVSSEMELALLVNFNLRSCVIKRVLNPKLLDNGKSVNPDNQ